MAKAAKFPSMQDYVIGSIWRLALNRRASKEAVVALLAGRGRLGPIEAAKLAAHWESTRQFRDMRAAARAEEPA